MGRVQCLGKSLKKNVFFWHLPLLRFVVLNHRLRLTGSFLDWCQTSHPWHSSMESEQKPIFLKSPPCISQWICLFHQKANFRISVTLFPIFCISSFLKMIYLVSADSSLGNTLFTVYSLTKADQLTASIPPPTSLSKCFSDTDLRVYSKKYFHLLLLAKASILLKF